MSSSSPIFVVGMNGSGTTLMLDCLNGHPALYGFRRETLVIPHFISRTPSYGDLGDDGNFEKLWNDFRGLSAFRWVNDGEAPPLPGDWRERDRSLASVIDGTFGYLAARQGKQRWCEKTPMHAQHIAALHLVFPHARFIHMIRDGRSCAASFHRRWGYVPERTIYRWKNVVRAARRQAAETGAPYLEVRYERLTQDPVTEMKRVCEFIGEPFDEAVLSSSRVRKHTGTTETEITATAPRWLTYFSRRRLAGLESIAGGLLKELDYGSRYADGDRDPPAVLLKLWMAYDYVRMGVRVLWREVRTPRDQKWDDLGSRIRNSVRQRLTSRF